MRTEERNRAVRRVIDQGEVFSTPGPSLGMNCRQSRRRSLTRLSPQRRQASSPKTVR